MKLVEFTGLDGATKFWINPAHVYGVSIDKIQGKVVLYFESISVQKSPKSVFVNESIVDAVKIINSGLA